MVEGDLPDLGFIEEISLSRAVTVKIEILSLTVVNWLERLRVPVALVETLRCRLPATVLRCVGDAHGEATMAIRILNEVLLFSCVLAFAMGVVLAAASMLQN